MILIAALSAAVMLAMSSCGPQPADVASSASSGVAQSGTQSGTESNNVVNVEAMDVKVTDCGVKADDFDSAKANTAALDKLIKSCPEGSTIRFPSGKYYLESSRGCIKIANKKMLTLIGEDAVIINTSFDPTVAVTDKTYHNSMTVDIYGSENILIEGLSFDYYRYTQVCGKIVEKDAGKTVIELDSRYIDGSDKPVITGKEIASAVNVLDENGAAIGDYYANGKYETWLEGNRYCILGSFGEVGREAVVRFNISYAPMAYAYKTAGFTARNLRSFSSPAATFLMSGEGNSDFSFDKVTVAPPEGAVWRWGSNVDGIFLNCMRGEVNITDCTFIGMGDDALNVHSSAAKVTGIEGNNVALKYGWDNSTLSSTWAKKGDVLKFYKSDFSVTATATVQKVKSGSVTIEITSGAVSVGDFVENTALSPKVNVENVTVDGGRARAFLLQTDNVSITNCSISNLGLAGIIIAPDLEQWYEMGPAENISITGCSFSNVCAMNTAACKGAIFSAASHSGVATSTVIHKNITVTGNAFKGFDRPAVNITSADGVSIKDNTYSDGVLQPVTSNCTNVK